MGNEWTRLYNKAVNLYNDGYINKSLEICEKILANDLSSSEVLNLKGLMLYQKGLLKDSRIVWKLNYDINKDMMAKKYIEDSESDENRLKLYKEAEYNLKNMNIDKALALFRECAQSDFNSIKVNTGIAMCYARKGDNFRAKEYVDKALQIDNEAVTANEVKKDLEKLGICSSENNFSKNILIVITILFVIGAIGIGGYSIYNKIKVNNSEIQYADNDFNSEEENLSISIENEDSETEQTLNEEVENISENYVENTNISKQFNKDNVSATLSSKDLDELFNQIDGVDKENLSVEELELYNDAVSLLKTDGVAKFYEYGVWYFNNKDYNSANDELNKAYKYCNENYLKEHIVFYKGSTASQIGDNNDALKLYKEYYSLYPKGAYIEGVLYELALLTNTTNKDMGKQYAEELVNKFPNSVYINDYIKEIIK